VVHQQFLYLHLNLIVELDIHNRNIVLVSLRHLRSYHYRIQDNVALFESVVKAGIGQELVEEDTQVFEACTAVELAPMELVVARVEVFLVY
jgi:hypothetical protein